MVTALKLTIDQLEALPGDDNLYELIDGELLGSKAPGISHQLSLGRLFSRLTDYLDSAPIGLLIWGPGVVFDDYNGVIPDMAIVSAERQNIVTERGLIDAPDPIVELARRENSERDRQLKRQLDSRRGVREYWIVDPQIGDDRSIPLGQKRFGSRSHVARR